MTARRWLFAYLAAVIAVTFIHQPAALAALLFVAVVAAGRARLRLLGRTVLAVFAFNLTVSAGYALIALTTGNFNAGYLLLTNLRVTLLVFLGFWFITRVALFDMLAGWPTATLVATLALGQIRSFERLIADFRLAFTSRNPAPPRLTDRARHAAVQGIALLDKSFAAATESTQALKSRGAFDD